MARPMDAASALPKGLFIPAINPLHGVPRDHHGAGTAGELMKLRVSYEELIDKGV